MGDGTNEVQTISLSNVTSGTFTLELDTKTTLPIAYNASAEEVAQSLRGLDGVGEDDVRVTQDITNEVQTITVSGATSDTFTLQLGTGPGTTTSAIAFNASAEEVAKSLISLAGVSNDDIRVADTANEVQTITLTGATTGDFTLTLDGVATTSIAFNAGAEEMYQALISLTAVGEDDVEVFSDTEGIWVVTFVGNLARQGISELFGNTNTTGGTIAIAETRAGTTGRWEVTFRDDLAGKDISTLVTTNTGGTITVAETTKGTTGPWVVTFVGNLAGKDINTLVTTNTFNALPTPGTINVAETTAGTTNTDTLISIELADLTGGDFPVILLMSRHLMVAR